MLTLWALLKGTPKQTLPCGVFSPRAGNRPPSPSQLKNLTALSGTMHPGERDIVLP